MEYSDKTSLDLIKALVKTFAKDFKQNPIIFVICYWEIPNSDLSFNNENQIQSIVNEANQLAKKAMGGSSGLKWMLSLGQ